MIMGVDEAGRGPVIGPMVICCAAVADKRLREVKALGVKDSKLLTPKKRLELSASIREICKYELLVLEPGQIDARVPDEATINQLEAECFARVIRAMGSKPKVVYLDACDVNAERFGINVKKGLDFEVEIVSRHKADRDYPIVSAASILAKVHRDALVEAISESIGEDVGSGYPNDPVTIEFLKSYYKKNKSMPPFVRQTWKTTADIISDCLQSRLTGFL
jgi:ribonuclease HII